MLSDTRSQVADLPLVLLGDGHAALAQSLQAAALDLALPCIRLAEAGRPLPCRFALACDDGQVAAAARLNDRNCTGGLSLRIASQLGDAALAPVLLGWMLGLPAQMAPATEQAAPRRIDRVGLLLTTGRAQVIWRCESVDGGDSFLSHAQAAKRLVGLALRTDWRSAKGWGRGLLHLTAIETVQGDYGLVAAGCGLPPDLAAIAAAGLPMAWGDLLLALLEDAPLCLTPPAPVVAVDAAGRVRLHDHMEPS